jgi:bifunctional non-homologous end joining protein LigD
VTWTEVEKGIAIDDFRLDNVRNRFAKVGDLWKPILAARGRTDLSVFLGSLA